MGVSMTVGLETKNDATIGHEQFCGHLEKLEGIPMLAQYFMEVVF